MDPETNPASDATPDPAPAGFPGSDRTPLDVEAADADRMERALAKLAGDEPEPPAEPTEEPTEESSEEPPAPTEEPSSSEPSGEPPAAPPAAEPSAEIAAALVQLQTMRAEMDADRAKLTQSLQSLEEREAKVAKFERFAELGEENVAAAVDSLGWDLDRVVKGLTHGKGVKTPEDRAAALIEESFSTLKTQLDAIKNTISEQTTQTNRLDVVREISSAEERAPLLAAFGDYGTEAVMKRLASATNGAGVRVSEGQVREAVSAAESELVENLLKVALSSKAVRRKYASLVGNSEKAPPVTPKSRSLNQRAASQVTRRSENAVTTEEERLERAYAVLDGNE